MSSPADRRYTDSHEWVRLDGDIATIGITRYAVDELTDITYVETKPAGTRVDAGDTVGEVESVKTTSDVYSALGGEIIEVNGALDSDPAALNRDPFEEGWLVKIRTSNPAPVEELMTQDAYDQKYPGG